MTREQLIASLTETAEHGWYATEQGDDRYADWSTREGDGVTLEVGDGRGTAVQMDLSRAELVALHRQLTLTLLAI